MPIGGCPFAKEVKPLPSFPTKTALPRWLLGIEANFEGITASSALPEDAYPAKSTLVPFDARLSD